MRGDVSEGGAMNLLTHPYNDHKHTPVKTIDYERLVTTFDMKPDVVKEDIV